MIEAGNSVIANASLVRAGTGQGGSERAEIPRSEIEVPKAPYISPYIAINNTYNKAVLQIRDSETGDVLTQFPSESRMRARQQEQAAAEAPRPQARDNAQSSSTAEAQQQQPDTSFVAQSIGSLDVPNVSSNVAQAQIASAALSSGAQSGQVFSGAVNVTA